MRWHPPSLLFVLAVLLGLSTTTLCSLLSNTTGDSWCSCVVQGCTGINATAISLPSGVCLSSQTPKDNSFYKLAANCSTISRWNGIGCTASNPTSYSSGHCFQDAQVSLSCTRKTVANVQKTPKLCWCTIQEWSQPYCAGSRVGMLFATYTPRNSCLPLWSRTSFGHSYQSVYVNDTCSGIIPYHDSWNCSTKQSPSVLPTNGQCVSTAGRSVRYQCRRYTPPPSPSAPTPSPEPPPVPPPTPRTPRSGPGGSSGGSFCSCTLLKYDTGGNCSGKTEKQVATELPAGVCLTAQNSKLDMHYRLAENCSYVEYWTGNGGCNATYQSFVDTLSSPETLRGGDVTTPNGHCFEREGPGIRLTCARKPAPVPVDYSELCFCTQEEWGNGVGMCEGSRYGPLYSTFTPKEKCMPMWGKTTEGFNHWSIHINRTCNGLASWHFSWNCSQGGSPYHIPADGKCMVDADGVRANKWKCIEGSAMAPVNPTPRPYTPPPPYHHEPTPPALWDPPSSSSVRLSPVLTTMFIGWALSASLFIILQ
eukprot:TRINITY_DN48144_c0_g1_i1.p1 TRINITY_DN48144_c0_g1~~TRINITY_DN48144_c0_g1_i1.p1  ORF type:complete len:534 (+),score=2.29 TRINITY_DN48144_c0_g1_i1:35-1636(+)